MSENENLISIMPDKELEMVLDGFRQLSAEQRRMVLNLLTKSKAFKYVSLAPKLRFKFFKAILLAEEANVYTSLFRAMIGDKTIREFIKSEINEELENDIFYFMRNVMNIMNQQDSKLRYGSYNSFYSDWGISDAVNDLAEISMNLRLFCQEFFVYKSFKNNSSYPLEDFLKKYPDLSDSSFRKLYKLDKELAMELAEDLKLTKYLMLK